MRLVHGFYHVIALAAQHLANQSPDIGFVLNQ
jgi:hypothetical protein